MSDFAGFDLFVQQVKKLMAQFITLKKENVRLQSQIEKLQTYNTNQKERIAALELEIVSLKVLKKEISMDDKEILSKKIDVCLLHLNNSIQKIGGI